MKTRTELVSRAVALACLNYHVYGRPTDEVDVVCTAAVGDSLGKDLRTTLRIGQLKSKILYVYWYIPVHARNSVVYI